MKAFRNSSHQSVATTEYLKTGNSKRNFCSKKETIASFRVLNFAVATPHLIMVCIWRYQLYTEGSTGHNKPRGRCDPAAHCRDPAAPLSNTSKETRKQKISSKQKTQIFAK